MNGFIEGFFIKCAQAGLTPAQTLSLCKLAIAQEGPAVAGLIGSPSGKVSARAGLKGGAVPSTSYAPAAIPKASV